MDLAAQLAEVDRLRLLAFPGQRRREGALASGRGFHVTALACGEDPQDTDPARRQEAEDDLGALCQALIELLARRWGDPLTLDLQPLLAAAYEGADVPPPLDALCGWLPEVYGWCVGERWIGLGVGSGGEGLAVRLVLAIGERTAYERAARVGAAGDG